jgi:hypothetical protein
MSSRVTVRRACVSALAVLVSAAGAFSVAATTAFAAGVTFAPHRAVYEMSYDGGRGSSGITDISGRLVFEVLGSPCVGYTVNRRFVSHISGDEIDTTSDQQLTTFEEADGSLYRFVSRSYFDEALSESTDGIARRQNGRVVVELTRPDRAEALLPDDVMFPFQHIHSLLEAAVAGQPIFAARLFEGSDTGHTVYETTAAIGNPHDPSERPDGPGSETLSELASWPVTIAYFDPGEDDFEVPKYEFSYDLYANGVSTKVHLDYGDFALRGKLTSIEFVEQEPCPE